jgi:hypothetical protein
MKTRDEQAFSYIDPKPTFVNDEPPLTTDDYDYQLRHILYERTQVRFQDGPDGRPEHPSARFWRTAAESIKNKTPPDFLIALFESFAELADTNDVLGRALEIPDIRSDQKIAAHNAKIAEGILTRCVANRSGSESFRNVRARAYIEIQQRISSPKNSELVCSEESISTWLDSRHKLFRLR